MLKKQTQRKLALYFSAMIFLNGFLVWRSEHGITIGLSDFSIFYTAGKILRDGRGHQLYDLNLQETVQRAAVPGAVGERRGAILPYNHPAFEGYAFLPLAFFPYRTAYLIWFSINIGFLAAVIAMLRQHLPCIGQVPLYLWVMGCLAFTPLIITLVQGQDSIALLFFYCMAFISLRQKAEFSAGAWIAAGLVRFQLSLPFIVPFLLIKRWRMLAGFCISGMILVWIALRVVGWAGVANYPAYVWNLEHRPKFHWIASSAGMPNLHGLISALLPQTRPGIMASLLLITSLILLFASSFGVRTIFKGAQKDVYLPFAANLITSVLISYHTWLHDLTILFLAVLLVLENFASGPLLPPSRIRTLGLLCIFLLWSPLDIILLHLQSLEILAIVLIVLLGTILIENRHQPPEPGCIAEALN